MLTCDYCNGEFMVDDEVKRFYQQDSEQAGYEFEMGRQRALKLLRDNEEMIKNIGPLTQLNKDNSMSRYIVFDVETPNRYNNRMSVIGICEVEGRQIVK